MRTLAIMNSERYLPKERGICLKSEVTRLLSAINRGDRKLLRDQEPILCAYLAGSGTYCLNKRIELCENACVCSLL